MPELSSHPYSPQDLYLPDYAPVSLPQSTIIGVYGVASLIVLSLIWILSGRSSKISKIDRILMCWWAFTGLTHIVLEGYFVFSPEFYKKKSPFYFSEVWKEYSKGDSRYAARNSAVVSLEGITAVLVGPASLLAVYATAAKKPYSYPLQLAISLAQLYGDILYFITAYLDGDNFASSSYYYWAYYVGANSSWLVIPMLIAIRSWKKISAAFVQNKSRGLQKKNKNF